MGIPRKYPMLEQDAVSFTHVYIVIWIRYYFTFLLGCQAARGWLARVGQPLSGVFSCLSVDGPRLWPFLCSDFLR